MVFGIIKQEVKEIREKYLFCIQKQNIQPDVRGLQLCL